MNKKTAILTMAIVLCGSFAATLRPAQSADDVKTAIQAAYDTQCGLLKGGDVDTAAQSLAPDFSGVDPSGKKEDRAATIADMKVALSQAKVTACTSKITAVSQTADATVLDVQQTMDGVTLGAAPSPVQVVSTQKDTWKLVSGKWLLFASAVSENTVSLNGTVIVHQGGPAKP